MTSPALPPLAPDGRAEVHRLLMSVAEHASAAVVAPPAVARGDWLGPASHACAQLEAELRGRLMVLLGEVDRAAAAA